MDYTLNFGAVFRGLDDLLSGLLLGLEMGLAGLVVGSVIGILAALAAVYGGRPARILVGAYVGLIRNVPILVLALFAFFALPGIGIRFSNVVTFAAVLAIYAGAYLTESFRAAILVIPTRHHRGGAVDRSDPDRHGDLGDPADRAPQRAAERRQQLHLAVQGYLDRRRDRRAGAHVPGAEDQQRELSRSSRCGWWRASSMSRPAR